MDTKNMHKRFNRVSKKKDTGPKITKIRLAITLVKAYKTMKKKSWKTTLGGVMIALGTPLSQVEGPDWVSIVGIALVSIGGLVMGASARDEHVTSEQANSAK